MAGPQDQRGRHPRQRDRVRPHDLFNRAKEFETRFQPDEALPVLERLFQVKPDHEGGKKLQALIQRRQEATKVRGGEIEQWVRQADRAYGQGDLRKASELYQQALELDYYNTSLRRKIDDVRRELGR